MKSLAVLLTCFNRKQKTLDCLYHLYKAFDEVEKTIDITIYLTDDGSTDGTGEAIKESYPDVHVLKGSGALYWAGGMRNSWNASIKDGSYDAYLLLNDDTCVYNHLFKELLQTHAYCLQNYSKPGIYVGSTRDAQTQELSYGGAVFTNKFLAQYVKVLPNNKPQECQLGNANIMLVHNEVVSEIGILSNAYIHGLADFDYTLTAERKNIPVLITPTYLGRCTKDKINPYPKFHRLSINDRIKLLYNPIGLDFKSNLQYMKRNFPYRLPFVYLAGWIKVLFPRIYNLRRRI